MTNCYAQACICCGVRVTPGAGLDRTYVSGIERGERNPSLTNLLRLVGALETTMSAIAARAEALVR